MKHRQPGLFDVEDRAAQLTNMGDPLVGLKARIDWEAFQTDLNRVHEKERKSQAGAKPFDVVLMFKILVLQQLHNLSDDGIEYQIPAIPSLMFSASFGGGESLSRNAVNPSMGA